jgi:hypothetical protein
MVKRMESEVRVMEGESVVRVMEESENPNKIRRFDAGARMTKDMKHSELRHPIACTLC